MENKLVKINNSLHVTVAVLHEICAVSYQNYSGGYLATAMTTCGKHIPFRCDDLEYVVSKIEELRTKYPMETSNTKDRLDKMETMLENLYYAPGMPGYVAAAEEFLNLANK